VNIRWQTKHVQIVHEAKSLVLPTTAVARAGRVHDLIGCLVFVWLSRCCC